jgi:hypothetical protein
MVRKKRDRLGQQGLLGFSRVEKPRLSQKVLHAREWARRSIGDVGAIESGWRSRELRGSDAAT